MRSGSATWESTMCLRVSSLIAVSTCAGYSTMVTGLVSTGSFIASRVSVNTRSNWA